MKSIYLLVLPLALASLACLQTTTLTDSAPSAAGTPLPDKSGSAAQLATPIPAILQENEAGAVYQPIEPDTLCVTAQVLHLRAKPNHKAIVINWLQAGTPVETLADAGDWTYIQAGEQVGYVRSRYLGECAE